jgi:SPP1 family predicted phage head-tail adaptor
MVQAGKLRHRIKIQEATETYNGVGEPVTTWTDYKIVWAEIRPMQGREYWASQQVNPEVTHRVTIRYLDGVTTEMRINFSDRIFAIDSILNTDEKNVELVVLCKENV